ncbi:DDE-type integrase/transposase/recombinase [Limibacillus sp. MBR-115]|uniref:DDE-type integrase/transposase/recombinase n=1 Tax=Limibacillus sp. MBR-115 TaxID=3156465 RepID=UPI00339A184E
MALRFLRKAMRRHGQPKIIVTDRLISYGAEMKEIGNIDHQLTGRWMNNRVENSHLPFRRRERASFDSAECEVFRNSPPSTPPSITSSTRERSLSSRKIFKFNRDAALDEWRGLFAA